MIEITRYHDISMGHRVYGHESKCNNLHGHNYRFHFTVRPKNNLDKLGRVIDFSAIKNTLCYWLEDNWDHKMLLWEKDPLADTMGEPMIIPFDVMNGIVVVPFNPTAENIAEYFLYQVAPKLFNHELIYLYSLKVEETAKCHAIATLTAGQEQMILSWHPFPKDKYCYEESAGRICTCKGKEENIVLNCSNCLQDLPF